MNAQPLDGYVVWIYGTPPDEKCQVQQAIFRDGEELAIDCECPYGGKKCLYSFVLHRRDGLNFTGNWTSNGAKQDSGTCDCRLYASGDRMACIGSWDEEGSSQSWYAEFHFKEKKA
jgi:hypothetical protein